MKSMRVLIDTNPAQYVMEKSMFGDVEVYLTGHSLADLFYILRKDFDVEKRKNLLLLLCDRLEVIAENKEILKYTLSSEHWPDLEDGLQMRCAAVENLDYIVTRNVKDFRDSDVLAILPEQFIALHRAAGGE